MQKRGELYFVRALAYGFARSPFFEIKVQSIRIHGTVPTIRTWLLRGISDTAHTQHSVKNIPSIVLCIFLLLTNS